MNLQGSQLAAPAAAIDDELEQVLLGLADGSYVLSTPDGAIAECGIGVAGLLGAPADTLVGTSTADVLVAGSDPAVRRDFEHLLHAHRADQAGLRTFPARTADGVTRSLRFVVVAVPLALGWEFTSLLSELRARDAGSWHPEALRTRHGRALEAVEGVVRHGAQPEPGARLAGILIVVRDVEAPPLTHEDVDRRMAEQREAAREAAAEAARRADEAAGRLAPADDLVDDGVGLEDIVERARVLRERVEEAEHDARAATLEREQALARLAEVEAELQDVRAAVDHERAAHSESAGAELATLRAELQTAHAELETAQAGLEAAHAELERLHADLQDTRGESSLARGEATAVRAELGSASEALKQMRVERDAHAAELADAKRQLAVMHDQLAELRSELGAAGAAAHAIRAEFGVPAPQAPTPPVARLELPVVGSGQAAALIALNGTFARLDDEFCRLLGCREEDLHAARWPSIIDRENLKEHQEIARRLKAGELHSAEIETVYMHAQGLLVPIAGTVTMHRAVPGGPATHFLFRADVSRTAGR
jgi:PAS domain S-box-containing protein